METISMGARVPSNEPPLLDSSPLFGIDEWRGRGHLLSD